MLFTRHFKGLCAFFFDRTDEDIEDLIQRTMLATLAAADRFEKRSRFSAFLYGTARNVLFEHYRARKKRLLARFDPETTTLVDLAISPSMLLRQEEERVLVRIAMCMIPLDDAILLSLYFVHGLTALELADQYGLSEDGLRARIRRARARLKNAVLEAAANPQLGERTSTDLQHWIKSLGEKSKEWAPEPPPPTERPIGEDQPADDVGVEEPVTEVGTGGEAAVEPAAGSGEGFPDDAK